ncbi:protein FAR1-RELATED SEQUENCE 12-like [Ipomoea triloba]|uniref:protein FAR1-RELATED SEQUENCE 12-like n=1 Tax=Ipomoea triloba TaxID=35885 RepID=UPI00125CE9E6|nr:protein FAR1-RELATED SEQUENCE 12-like [Ipomoea triloba]
MGEMLGRSNLIDDIDLNALIVEDCNSSTPVECNLPNGVESDSLVVCNASSSCFDGDHDDIRDGCNPSARGGGTSTDANEDDSSIPANQELVGHSVYSLEEAFDMYNDLASRMGFSVRKGNFDLIFLVRKGSRGDYICSSRFEFIMSRIMGEMLGRSNLIDDIDLNALIVEDCNSSTPVECNLPNGVESDSLVVCNASSSCFDGDHDDIRDGCNPSARGGGTSTDANEDDSSIPANQELVGHSVYSLEEAFDMYNDLASRMGFSVRKGKQYYFPGTRNVKSKKFYCYKAGLKAKQASANKCYTKIDTRTGCDAMCQFDLDSSGKWVVTKHVKEHNHELCPASASYMLRSHRNVSVDQLTYLKDMKRSGVPLYDGIQFLKHQSGGSPFVGFTARDAYNTMLLDSAKHLDGTDSNTLIEIFRKRQLNESSFFFDFEVDDDARLCSFFGGMCK